MRAVYADHGSRSAPLPQTRLVGNLTTFEVRTAESICCSCNNLSAMVRVDTCSNKQTSCYQLKATSDRPVTSNKTRFSTYVTILMGK